MDNLTLSYNGNQLAGVTETALDYSAMGTFEYKRANGSQYIYDSNGSMIADKSRGIAYITYDVNSNPQSIYFTNGSVTKYVYGAAGQKLKAVHYTAKPNITRPFGLQPLELAPSQILYTDSTDYLLGGSLVMKNGRIDKFLFDGGYAQASPTGATTDNFILSYYNQDHLGNNREVIGTRGAVRQVTNYYPFGTPFTETADIINPDAQPYKYNGKELDRMHGLDTYDYGARQYYPILGRWDRVDPLCEKYYSISPYAYCHNNPVMLVDPDGKDDYVIDKDGYIRNETSFTDKIKAFFGFGRNDDRIFLKGSDNPLLTLPKGTITNLADGKDYSKFEIKDANLAETAFQTIALNSDVEWAHIRHGDNNSESSLIINNHKDQDVSVSAEFARDYVNKGESIPLFEHSHPLAKEYKYNGIPNIPLSYPPSNYDMNTAGNYPNTIHRVYDIYNRKVYEYDKKGIKSIRKM
jgi:RHS repeat-associated protein